MEISIVNPNQIAAEGQRLVQLGLVMDFYQHIQTQARGAIVQVF